MSGSGLAKKLGLKQGMSVLLLGAPQSFTESLGEVPASVTWGTSASQSRASAVVAFVRTRAEIAALAPKAIAALEEDGLLWFAYPKKSGGIKSDITRDQGWETVFAAGYDSVAQVAIDTTWTGLRFRPAQLVKH